MQIQAIAAATLLAASLSACMAPPTRAQAGTQAPAQAGAQLTQINSPYSFSETVQRVESTVLARGLSMIAKVDHSAGATSVGMSLRPTTVLIFGNPRGSTPMMQVQQTLAIDLPLKALVWTAEDGKVKVAVNAAELYQRHGLNADQTKVFGGVAALVEAALK